MSGIVTVTILSDGINMNAEHHLVSVDITKEINRIPYAELVLVDGVPARQKFAISNEDFFKPGKTIEIKIRYEGDAKNEQTVFKGKVIRHGVKATPSESLLNIYLKDIALSLITQRKNAVFRDLKDTEIISKIAQDGGLKVKAIANTKAQHAEMVQYYCTDWDFIVSRADVNGHWVIVDDGQITVVEPKVSGSAQHRFTYGIDQIYDFEFEADIQHQYQTVDSAAWDLQQQATTSQTAQDFKLPQGNLVASSLGKDVGADAYHLSHGGTLAPDELQAWADAKLRKSRLAMLRGQFTIPGDAGIKVGHEIELDGIGDRFNGNTLITGIRHRVTTEGWQTSIQFGLSPAWFAQQDDICALPAAGLVPAIQGLQIGIVDAFEEDPDKQFRVKVKVPTLRGQSEDAVLWARLATLDAGKQRGIVFRPEPGDEVVLGFLNSDPRQAIILGSMYSETNDLPPGFNVTTDNFQKGIVTRESLQLLLDDENKVIQISTPNSNSLRVSDADKGVHIEDENGNQLTLNDQGIVIKSAKDIAIEGQNITIKGSKVDVN